MTARDGPLTAAARYDVIGQDYARRRQPDPRIAAQIAAGLEGMGTIVNVGAGSGSYEPAGRALVAVEPSHTMIAQRPADAAPCARARAEALPFPAQSFDAGLAILTIHHWTDWRAGLRELRRVARHRIVLLTFDVEATHFWLSAGYLPALLDLDRRIMPRLHELEGELGPCEASAVPIPHDCADGFLGAYWRRPETYLEPAARRAMSSFAHIDADEGLARLAADLASGAWHRRHADLLARDTLDLGYRLLRWG